MAHCRIGGRDRDTGGDDAALATMAVTDWPRHDGIIDIESGVTQLFAPSAPTGSRTAARRVTFGHNDNARDIEIGVLWRVRPACHVGHPCARWERPLRGVVRGCKRHILVRDMVGDDVHHCDDRLDR